MKELIKKVLIFFLAFIAIAAVFNTYSQSTATKPTPVDTAVFIDAIEIDTVVKIEVEGSRVIATLADETKKTFLKEPGESLTELLKNYGVTPEKFETIPLEIKEPSGFAYWAGAILPFLIPFLLIGAFIWFMMRQVQGANSKAMMFGQSSAKAANPKDAKNRVTFAGVAGAKEAKEELMEVVDFLKSPKKFTSLGAKLPKGVLLMGAPGTGKTLLARAVAGEANVPFFHISGSEFVEMFVGVGASRVRDLFDKAKKNAPCIVFVDEIDAVGRQRGAGLGGSHDEREQTLNQILVEMDGFDPNAGIIVLAATNRPDVLDPALLRPGRFDRQVVIDMPDINDREAILKIHASNKPLAPNVSLRKVAERTPGFSGADLANVVNEAAIATARQNRKIVEEMDLLNAIEKVMLGPERKSHILSDKEKNITAYHEAGHALVAHMLPHADPVHKISIISRGRAAGYTLKLPTHDKSLKSRGEFIDELAVLLGGRVAEKLIFNEITTGASSDLKEATKSARSLITLYGMSDALGPRTFGQGEEMVFLGRDFHEKRDYSEKVAENIDAEINRLVLEAQETATRILTKEKALMEKVVAKLLEKETLEREAFEELVGEKPKA